MKNLSVETITMLLTKAYPTALLFSPLQPPAQHCSIPPAVSLLSLKACSLGQLLFWFFQTQTRLYKVFAGKRKSLSGDNNNYSKLLGFIQHENIYQTSWTQNQLKKSCLQLKTQAFSEAIVLAICTLAIHDLQDDVFQFYLWNQHWSEKRQEVRLVNTVNKGSLTQDYNVWQTNAPHLFCVAFYNSPNQWCEQGEADSLWEQQSCGFLLRIWKPSQR